MRPSSEYYLGGESDDNWPGNLLGAGDDFFDDLGIPMDIEQRDGHSHSDEEAPLEAAGADVVAVAAGSPELRPDQREMLIGPYQAPLEGMQYGDVLVLVNGNVKLSAFHKWLIYMHKNVHHTIEFCLSPLRPIPRDGGHLTSSHAEFKHEESGRRVWLYFCPPLKRKCSHPWSKYICISGHRASQDILKKKKVVESAKDVLFRDEAHPFCIRLIPENGNVEVAVAIAVLPSAEDIRNQWHMIKQGGVAAVELVEDWVRFFFFFCLCTCSSSFFNKIATRSQRHL